MRHVSSDTYDLRELLALHQHEPVVCSFFGCGRTLTCREMLLGSVCVEHSGKRDQLVRTVRIFCRVIHITHLAPVKLNNNEPLFSLLSERIKSGANILKYP